MTVKRFFPYSEIYEVGWNLPITVLNAVFILSKTIPPYLFYR